MATVEKEITMQWFDANREDYGILGILFDDVSCANQISMMYASSIPHNPVRGRAEFVVEIDDEPQANEDGSVKKEWREGIIEWWTITPPLDY